MKKITTPSFLPLSVLIYLFSQLLFSACANAQNAPNPEFRASIDQDTIALEGYLTLTVTFQNCDAKGFQLPEMPNFQLVGQPSSQTSMSMINGKTTTSSAYTYRLKPKKTGKFTLDKISLKMADGKTLETDKIKIVVLEKYKNNSTHNHRKQVSPPVQSPFFEPPFGQFPQSPFEKPSPKPKRKTIQI
ncbi:MAG: hypothetical protein RI894_246 [Bacteroidota bacterium]|jgi:hypothetical protein